MKLSCHIRICLALVGAMGMTAGVVLCTLTGCSTVSPGNDPLVVHVEQTETVAYSTFDTFLKLDDANRALVIAQAPTVHAFAETLRAPVMDGTNLTRTGLLWVLQLDRVKQAYVAGQATSNTVVTALAVVETAVASAQQDVVAIGGLK